MARFKIEASNGLFNNSGKTVMMSILINAKMRKKVFSQQSQLAVCHY